MVKVPHHIAIVDAGIVGVSTAIWLQRAGRRVTLVDRVGPGDGASFGNGGVLAAAAITPVTVPGLLRTAPRMLFDPNQPLFLKMGLPATSRPLAGRVPASCQRSRCGTDFRCFGPTHPR